MGREAGLGNTPPLENGTPERAWPSGGAGTVKLPVYHHWRFRTGPAGDFETLAQKLKGVTPAETVGERQVHIDPVLSRFPQPADFEPITLNIPTAIARHGQPGVLSIPPGARRSDAS
jgi:hypothetical protein